MADRENDCNEVESDVEDDEEVDSDKNTSHSLETSAVSKNNSEPEDTEECHFNEHMKENEVASKKGRDVSLVPAGTDAAALLVDVRKAESALSYAENIPFDDDQPKDFRNTLERIGNVEGKRIAMVKRQNDSLFSSESEEEAAQTLGYRHLPVNGTNDRVDEQEVTFENEMSEMKTSRNDTERHIENDFDLVGNNSNLENEGQDKSHDVELVPEESSETEEGPRFEELKCVESGTVGNKTLPFGKEKENEDANYKDTKQAKIKFKVRIRLMLALFFAVINQTLEKDSLVLHYVTEHIQSVRIFIDLWAVRFGVIPIPEAAGNEAYRLSTFGQHAGLSLGVSIMLSREGFFCDMRQVLCGFCGRMCNRQILVSGQRLVNFLNNHRAICFRNGNIPMEQYGGDIQALLVNSEVVIPTPSGLPYKVTGTICFQRDRAHLLQNMPLYCSGGRYTQNEPLLLPNLPGVRDQGRAWNWFSRVSLHALRPFLPALSRTVYIDLGNQPSRGVYGSIELPSHSDLSVISSEQMELRAADLTGPVLPLVIRNLIDSSIGSQILRMGFSRNVIMEAISHLMAEGREISFEDIMEVLEVIGAHPAN